jgi:hypothetical protein
MFTMSDPEQLSVLLTRAGFDQPEIQRVETPYRFADASDLWSWVTEIAGPLAPAIRDLREAERGPVRTAIEQRAEPFRRADGSYELPSASLLVSAVKSRRGLRPAIRPAGSSAAGAAYSRIAGLPLVIDSYSLQPLSRVITPEVVARTNVVRLHGAQHEGVGEDVTPFPPRAGTSTASSRNPHRYMCPARTPLDQSPSCGT